MGEGAGSIHRRPNFTRPLISVKKELRRGQKESKEVQESTTDKFNAN